MHIKTKLKLIMIFLFFSIFLRENTFSINILSWEVILSWSKQLEIAIPKWLQWEGNKLNYIDVRFCNNWIDKEKLVQNLSMVTRPWEEKEFCIIIFNRDSENHDIWYWFPKWVWEGENTNCDIDYWRTNPFGKFVKPFDTETITIPANWYIIKKTTMKFPAYVNWMQKWCFAFGISWGTRMAWWWWISLAFVNRRVNFLNVLIEWEGKIENKITIKNITSKKDENQKLLIQTDIENKWSIDQIVNITWELSSIFWYRELFSMSWIISMNNHKTLNTKDFWKNFEIPRYKWPLKIKMIIQYKPYFDFDISNSWLDPKLLEEKTITQTKNIFIFPMVPAIGLVIFILLIYLAFFRKPKIVIQQAK